jgi:hypothetical protein
MRRLRFLGPGDDDTVILRSLDGTEHYRLEIDEKLASAVMPGSVALPKLSVAAEPPRGQSTNGKDAMDDLRPRDIQTRVRAGEDPQALAEEAGQPLDRVMRFAYPVLQERVRIVDEARRGRTRAGSDNQTTEFGSLFDHRLGVLGTEPTSVRWDSFRRPDGGWTVTAVFTADIQSIDPQQLTAKFSFALTNRMVSALNDVAADLISGNPISALVVAAPAPIDYAALDALSSGAAAPTRLAAVPDPEPDHADDTASDTDPAGAERAEARSALRLPLRRQKAHTHPLPVSVDDDVVDELFDQDAADPAWASESDSPSGTTYGRDPLSRFDPGAENAALTDTASTTAPLPSPGSHAADAEIDQPARASVDADSGVTAESGGHADSDALELEPDGAFASVGEDTPHSHRRPGRASDKPRMPSWDDILLGVRRRSD